MRTLIGFLLCASLACAQDGKPLRVAIAGLAHGHVDGFFRALQKRKDVEVVGVFDPDPGLHKKYGDLYGIASGLFFTDLGAMLDKAKPEAVATFTNTFDHPVIVEACAARKIPVMMEKPLAVSMDHARRIQKASERSGIPVIVNYETTWYRSHAEMHNLIKDQKAMGDIRKMVAMDGHEGPREINVPPEFLGWLSDPVKNGAGALFDFGCYGANLMTWMMDNQYPIKVTAMTQQIKPEIYPRVDDEATVLVEYPHAQGIIQGSWNWPFGRKDFEVYAQRGYADAIGGNTLRVRLPGRQEESRTPAELAPDERDSVSYLIAVVRGKRKPAGLSSLENNMIVTEILTAARESARSGKTVAIPAK
jgi:predicted dehydrogenase